MGKSVVENEMHCKWFGIAARGASTVISIFILTLAASSGGALQLPEPSPFETLSDGDLHTLLHADQPKLRVNTEALSLAAATSTSNRKRFLMLHLRSH